MATYNEPLMAYSSPYYAYDGSLVAEQVGSASFVTGDSYTATADDDGQPNAEMVIS